MKAESAALEYQMLMQQFHQLQQNLSSLEQHIEDLKKLEENLHNLSQIKEGTETLIPVGSGIFFKGQVKDTKNLIMNVGANVCVEKDNAGAIQSVQEQVNEVEGLLGQMEAEAQKIATRLEELKQAQ